MFGASGTFVFRSNGVETKTLQALVQKPRRFDIASLAATAFDLPPTKDEETPYENITAVSVGPHSINHSSVSSLPRTLNDAPRFLLDALDGALERLLTNERRVAVATGGGVDSGAMLALTVRWTQRDPNRRSVFAVALDFEGSGDDRPHLRILQNHLRCEVLRVSPEEGAKHLDLFERGVDAAPFSSALASCEMEMLSRARTNGAGCVLTGAGGDELFDGVPRSLATVARDGHPLRAIASARALRGFDQPRKPVLSWVVRPMLVQAFPHALRRRVRRLSSRSNMPDWAGPALRDVVRRADERRSLLIELTDTPKQRFDALTQRRHRANIVWLRHQQMLAAQISRIDPYLDVDLVQSVTSLKPSWLLHGDRRRGLFREAMRDVLPSSLRERMDKAAFEPALKRFLAAAGGRERLLPLTTGRCLADLGIVNSAPFEAAARSFLDDPKDEEWVTLWSALAVESFLRSSAELS